MITQPLPSALLLISIATLGVSSFVNPVLAGGDPPKFTQAKACFMKLELSNTQKIKLLALRTRLDLTDQQRLDEAVKVLDTQQQKQFRQCATQPAG